MATTLATPQDIARGVFNIPHLPQAHALPLGPLIRMARAMQQTGSLEDREGRLNADATQQLLTTTHPDVHRLAVNLSRLGWRDTPSDVFICPPSP